MGRRRDLVLLVAGTVLSAVGTYVTFVALPFHFRHDGPYVISGLMMASLIPVAAGGPVAGWLVDRLPNRRMAVWTQLVAAAAAVALVFALGTLPLVFALLFVIGSAAAVTSPAISALLPRLTGEDAATRGYGTLATARSVGTLAGLGIGGTLAAGPGVRAALVVDAASFLAMAAALAVIQAERDPRAESTGRKALRSGDALAGLRFLRADRVLFAAIAGMSLAVLLAVLVNVADVYFVTEVLRAGGIAYGVIAASWAVGMVAGGKLAGHLLRTDRLLAAGLFGGGVLLGAVLLVPAAFPTVPVTVLSWLVGGACNATQNVAIQGLVRSRVPDGLRGRAFAGQNSAVVTANVLGTFVGGPATAVLGPRGVFVTAGVGTALSAAAALAVVLPRLAAAPAAAPPAAAQAAPMDPPGALVRTPPVRPVPSPGSA